MMTHPACVRPLAALLVAAAASFWTSGQAQAATLTVGAGGTYATIQAAVDAASPGDTISIAAGTYHEAIRISKGLTLVGARARSAILDGAGLNAAVVSIVKGDVKITMMTIRNGGSGVGSGGGVANFGGTLTVSDSTISGNKAHFGGGIYNSHLLTVTGCTISDNKANDSGGGIYNTRSVTVAGSVISGNSALGTGGGISSGGTVSVRTSTISGNSADNEGGGGIATTANTASLTVSDSTISGNSAKRNYGNANSVGSGGGIKSRGVATVQNSTLSGNFATDVGGAIHIYASGSLTVRDCTVSGNSTAGTGGGIHSYASGTAIVGSSTIAGNEANFGSGVYAGSSGRIVIGHTVLANQSKGGNCDGRKSNIADDGYNLVSSNDACGLKSGVNGNVVTATPGLGPLQDNGGRTPTMALLPGSPAINAGGTGGGATTDQRGYPRPAGGACDIGAFELGGRLSSRITLDTVPTTWSRGQSQAVTVTILNDGVEPWTVAHPVRLSAFFLNGPLTASPGQNWVEETITRLPVALNLAPGKAASLAFTVKAPQTLCCLAIGFSAFFLQGGAAIPGAAAQPITQR